MARNQNPIQMESSTHVPAPGLRPTFLSVLCILSFLFGAYSLWEGISSAFTDAPQRELAEAKAEMEKAVAEMGGAGGEFMQNMMDSAMAMAEKAAEKAKPMGYATIALALLSLFGVWNMWNLKKSGFWMYVAASVAGLIAPVVFLGGGLMTILSVGVMGFISIIFIVLYGLNLKHMH